MPVALALYWCFNWALLVLSATWWIYRLFEPARLDRTYPKKLEKTLKQNWEHSSSPSKTSGVLFISRSAISDAQARLEMPWAIMLSAMCRYTLSRSQYVNSKKFVVLTGKVFGLSDWHFILFELCKFHLFRWRSMRLVFCLQSHWALS